MFDVSIIIPVYKAKYTIKKTLESINNQKFKNKIPKLELILSIDDNKNYEKYRSILKSKYKENWKRSRECKKYRI